MQTEQTALLTPEELAEKLKISPRTLWRLLAAEKVPKPIRFGGSTRWRLAEVQEWIAQGCPGRNT